MTVQTLTIRIPGALVGKGRPRFTRSGIAYTPERTRNAETWIRSCVVEQVGQPCIETPIALDIVVGIAVPTSWSKIKQRRALSGELHPVSRPDADNLLKIIADSCNKLLFKDDAQVWRVSLTKRFAEAPDTVVTVTLADHASFAFRERAA